MAVHDFSRLTDAIAVLLASPDPGQTSGQFSRTELQGILEEHHRYLMALLVYKTGDRDLAADLLQETYLSFLAQAPRPESFPTAKKLRNYLTTIALNKVRDQFRRQRTANARVKVFLDREELDLAIEGLESNLGRPDEDLVQKDEKDRLERAVQVTMEGLPPTYRRILVLKFKDGLDNPAIGLELKLGPKAVESLLFRARHQFRRDFEKLALYENVFYQTNVHLTR